MQKPKKPFYKKWWVIAIAAFFLLMLIGNIASLVSPEEEAVYESAPVSTTTTQAPPSTTQGPTTTTFKPTDETCFNAFKTYSDAVAGESAARDAYTDELANGNGAAQEPPILDEGPLQNATLANCSSKVSWILFAQKFQGFEESDLFLPKLLNGKTGDDALRSVYTSFCDEPGSKKLTACKNTFG
jgi:hypothetical protein